MELVQTFNTTLNDFITNLKRCYPEETSVLNKIDMLQDTRPLQKFMKCVGTNMDKISKMDNSLFEEQFIFVDNFDLSTVFKSTIQKSNQDKNIEAIWKFLQTLSLIGTTIRSKSSNLEDFFEQFSDENFMKDDDGIQEQMMEMIQKLMDNSEIDEDAAGAAGAADDEDAAGADNSDDDTSDGEDPTDKYNDMFKDTKIGNLAKEIAEDIDMSAFDMSDINDMNTPDVSSVMQKLVGGGGLKNLVQTVASKLKTKMESGDVNQEELIGEVHTMMEKMQKDKKFKKMFKSKDVQGIFKEFMKQKGQEVNDDDDFSALEEMCADSMKKPGGGLPNFKAAQAMRGGGRRNGVRNRLRRKLEAKNREEKKTLNSEK